MDKVTIRSYPRVHFGLLELSGNYARIDGSAGLAVSAFPMTVTVSDSEEFCIDTNNADAERICRYTVSDLSPFLPSLRIRIAIHSDSRMHLGLGFSTQCALTVGCAILTYFNIPFSQESLALSVRRGGTSGIGIRSFFNGGFIIDGGHLFPEDKDSLGPSSKYTLKTIPPLIARIPFPDWKICIAIPTADTYLGGESEINFWENNTPIPEDECNYLCKNLLLGIMPALCEKNFNAFCGAMHNSTYYGLKKREIDYWQPQYEQCKQIMEECGWSGVTLSSLGPAIIGFSDSQIDNEQAHNELSKYSEFQNICIASARNAGYDDLSKNGEIC